MLKDHAFIIIELCVVLFIISILALMALPAYQSFLKQSQIDIAKEKVLRMISIAQKTAVNKHVYTSICKTKDFTQCDGDKFDNQLVATHVKRNGEIENNDEDDKKNHHIMFAETLSGILYWRSFPRYRSHVVFNPNGLLDSNDNATFWYCLDKQSKPAFVVRLSKAGRHQFDYPDRYGEFNTPKRQILSCA